MWSGRYVAVIVRYCAGEFAEEDRPLDASVELLGFKNRVLTARIKRTGKYGW